MPIKSVDNNNNDAVLTNTNSNNPRRSIDPSVRQFLNQIETIEEYTMTLKLIIENMMDIQIPAHDHRSLYIYLAVNDLIYLTLDPSLDTHITHILELSGIGSVLN